jgi:hypothetical protein
MTCPFPFAVYLPKDDFPGPRGFKRAPDYFDRVASIFDWDGYRGAVPDVDRREKSRATTAQTMAFFTRVLFRPVKHRSDVLLFVVN